jgi:hypothetical protein
MITTNFIDSIQREDKPIQRKILECVVNSPIVFHDPPTREFDDIVELNGKKGYFEYKMDDRAQKTGNMVLELITYIPSEEIHLIGESRVVIDGIQKKSIIENIDKFSRPSKHIKPDKPFYFFYSIKYGNTYTSLLFRSKKLSDYFIETYRNRTMILTKTNDKRQYNKTWNTLSILYPIKELREQAFKFKEKIIIL